MSFVLDCSVAITWCFADEATPQGDALLERLKQGGAIVPTLWHLEIGNVLVRAERRGRVTAAILQAQLALLRKLPITIDDQTTARALTETLTLARNHQLTTYDAAYLELAMRQSKPLATNDRQLQQAAAHVGVQVLTA
ncbi:MAG: type II toxin-antitoxin system VapC family toxin [Pseudomonadota bacterium]